MPVFEIILLLLMPALLVGSASCSAMETALFSLSHADRLRLRRQHPAAHHAVTALLANPRSLLISILVVNVAINTLYFAVSAVVATELFRGVWLVVYSVSALMLMIVGAEVIPKSLAAAHRVRFCALLAPVALTAYRVVEPLGRLAEFLVIAPLSRLFGSGDRAVTQISAEELGELLAAGGKQGVIHEQEERLLAGVLTLGALRVSDVMTPRVDLAWIESKAMVSDLLALMRKTGHSKFPVCTGHLDESQIVGVVNVQRALPKLNRGEAASVASVMEPARYMPDRARLDQLLEHFRTSRSDVALCVNESGDLTGWVELDDVIREVVSLAAPGGETSEDQVLMVGVGVWEVPGRLNIREWAELFDVSAAERAMGGARGRVSTLGGLIVSKLGRVPRLGDELQFPTVKVRVSAVGGQGGRSVERVTVSVVGGNDEAALARNAEVAP
jgi:putative hemolysin